MKETVSYNIFFRENIEDLKKMLMWKTGLRDHDYLDDFISKLLLHMMENGTLERYDKSKGSFDTYIVTCTFRFMQNERKRETTEKSGFHINKVEYDEIVHGEEELITEISDIEIDWKEFYYHVQKTTSISDKKKRILELAAKGLNGVEISEIVGLTPQAISLHLIELRKLWYKFYNKEFINGH